MRQKLSLLAIAGLFAAAAPVHADGVYAKAGFLGVGIGYGHAINPAFTLRGDISTVGTFKRDGSASGFDYKAKLRNNQATVYFDYFPFASGFRLTAGVGVRDTRVTGDARPNSAGTVEIGGTVVAFGPGDSATAKVKMPSVAPYLGIGYTSNPGGAQKGWGFIADLGVYLGKPKTTFDVSDSVRAKLGANAQQAIDKQRDDIHDKAKKLRVFPNLYVGVSYTF